MPQLLFACLAAMGLSCSTAAFAAGDVVACDLFDEASLSSLIKVNLTAAINRQKLQIDGSPGSICEFSAKGQKVQVKLLEHPSASDASKKFSSAIETIQDEKMKMSFRAPFVVDGKYGIGDKAFWYQVNVSRFGMFAVKGQRTLAVDFTLSEPSAGSKIEASLKERGRAYFEAALKKL
jgi:hypothetical protein